MPEIETNFNSTERALASFAGKDFLGPRVRPREGYGGGLKEYRGRKGPFQPRMACPATFSISRMSMGLAT